LRGKVRVRVRVRDGVRVMVRDRVRVRVRDGVRVQARAPYKKCSRFGRIQPYFGNLSSSSTAIERDSEHRTKFQLPHHLQPLARSLPHASCLGLLRATQCLVG
jgi:hypothetical protein